MTDEVAGWKMTDCQLTDEIAGVDDAGLAGNWRSENDGLQKATLEIGRLENDGADGWSRYTTNICGILQMIWCRAKKQLWCDIFVDFLRIKTVIRTVIQMYTIHTDIIQYRVRHSMFSQRGTDRTTKIQCRISYICSWQCRSSPSFNLVSSRGRLLCRSGAPPREIRNANTSP